VRLTQHLHQPPCSLTSHSTQPPFRSSSCCPLTCPRCRCSAACPTPKKRNFC
jgi:hypothetical protein